MSVFIAILIWLHFMGLAMGVGGGMANSQVGPMLAGSTGETRPVLWKLEHAITRISLVGLVLLLVTGPLILWLQFGGQAPHMVAFGVKMVLVLLLLVSITITIRSAGRAEKGDQQAGLMMKRAGMTSGGLAALIVLSAAFAFN